MIWLVIAGVMYAIFFSASLDPEGLDGLAQALVVGALRGSAWVVMMASLFHGLVQVGVFS